MNCTKFPSNMDEWIQKYGSASLDGHVLDIKHASLTDIVLMSVISDMRNSWHFVRHNKVTDVNQSVEWVRNNSSSLGFVSVSGTWLLSKEDALLYTLKFGG